MCEKCNTHDNRWKWESIPLNCGVLGDFRLDVAVYDDGKLEVAIGQNEDLFAEKIDICYCPYCGRKLK